MAAEEAVSGVEARSVGRSVVVSPLHTAPSRALASVVPSQERTGGLCARAGGGGVRPGPEYSVIVDEAPERTPLFDTYAKRKV